MSVGLWARRARAPRGGEVLRRAAGGGGRGGGFDGAPLSRAARGAFSWFGSGTQSWRPASGTHAFWGGARQPFVRLVFSVYSRRGLPPRLAHTFQDDTDSILLKTRGARVFCCCVGAPGGSGLPSLARVFGRVFPFVRGSFRSSLPGSWPLPPPPPARLIHTWCALISSRFFCLSGSGRPL